MTPPVPAPLREAVDSYLLDVQLRGCSPTTIARYRTAMNRLPEWPVTRVSVKQVITKMIADQCKPWTIKKQIVQVGTFCRWAVDEGLLSDDPTRGLKYKVPKTFPRVPTPEEIKRLLEACRPSWAGARARFVLS